MTRQKTVLLLIAAMAATFLNLFCVHAGLDAIGTYDQRDIIGIRTEDLDGDRLKETIISSDKGIAVLNSDTTPRWSFDIDGMKALYVSDVDGDGKKEILISSGRVVNGIEKGNLYMLNGAGKAIHKYEFAEGDAYPHLLYYSLAAADMDGNGYEEIIGGCSNGVYALKDTYDRINWSYRTNDTIKTLLVRDTGGLGEILAATSTKLFVLSMKGALKRNYTIQGGIKSISVADVAESPGDEVIVVSGDDTISILKNNLDYDGGTNFVDEITELAAYDVNNDSTDEIVIGSKKGVYVLNQLLASSAKYLTGEPIHGLYYIDWDGDKEKEIVFGSGGYVYALSAGGVLKDKVYVAQSVENLILDDLDYDGYWDLLVKSKWTVYFFENRQSKVKGEAREKYITAKSFFEAGRYADAQDYLQQAKDIYSSIGDLENVRICQDLEREIEASIRGEKTDSADMHYQSAERYFKAKDYVAAIDELSKARDIYSQLGDNTGLGRCTNLSEKIKSDTTPDKGYDMNVSSIFNPPKNVNMFPIFSIFIMVAIVMLLVILIVNRK